VKLVHEVQQEVGSRCILKRAISDFQRRGGGWTSKRDKIRGMKYDYQFEEMTLGREVD